jgi:hypothetical protein
VYNPWTYVNPMPALPYLWSDPSNAGGYCRQKCYAQLNPTACCAAKRGVCRDSDCTEDGRYTGNMPPNWAGYGYGYGYGYDGYDGEFVYGDGINGFPFNTCSIQCARSASPEACCRLKPSTCYDPNCFSGEYSEPTLPLFNEPVSMLNQQALRQIVPGALQPRVYRRDAQGNLVPV